MIPRIGDWVKRHRERLWTALVLLLAAWSAYNVGLIRARQGARPLQDAAMFRETVVSQAPASVGKGTAKPAADRSDPRVVVSKSSSSKKYHHTWCAGAKQIKEENRVWFPTADAARAAGYSLAGNCSE